MQLLKDLCTIHAPSGNEIEMKNFILNYIRENQSRWKTVPIVLHGKEFQNCILLVFGTPRTAVFAHMDSIGYMVRYGNELIPIGGPHSEDGYILVGEDAKGKIACKLHIDAEEKLTYSFQRNIDRGTELVFAPNFREDEEFVQTCYLDNRLGVYNCLKLAETLTDGIIAFSCWEEHGGGSVPYLCKHIYEKYEVSQALISDITWVTEGVFAGKGVAVSLRDRSIPNRQFVLRILDLLKDSGIPFQVEVEQHGGSDGKELQSSPYPYDWCFIGAPEQHVHSPNEKVHKKDIESMLSAYRFLMEKL